ncbi:MAG: peroxiredoxin [Actinomycetaceae bacterium]|nr:peroxiredoxin [Actinomycetaceae bacterium]
MTKLEIGQPAPNFTLASTDGEYQLHQRLADCEKGIIVYFYPRANTPGCTTEACDFRDSMASLIGCGYSVVGISPDKVDKLNGFQEKYSLPFPLAADPEKEVLTQWGAFGEKKNYGKLIKGVIRSTFVVGKDGKIAHAWYNVRAKGHVQRIRRDLECE